jgi:hypothetical protein
MTPRNAKGYSPSLSDIAIIASITRAGIQATIPIAITATVARPPNRFAHLSKLDIPDEPLKSEREKSKDHRSKNKAENPVLPTNPIPHEHGPSEEKNENRFLQLLVTEDPQKELSDTLANLATHAFGLSLPFNRRGLSP